MGAVPKSTSVGCQPLAPPGTFAFGFVLAMVRNGATRRPPT